MSDYDGDRPPKRRRRNSFAETLPEDKDRREQYREQRRDSRSPESNGGKRLRDSYDDRKEKRASRHSSSLENKSLSRHRYDRSRRSMSSDKFRDRERGREGKDPNRDRSFSPPTSRPRHGDELGDQSRDRHRKRDRPNDRRRSRSPKPFQRSRGPLPSQNDAFSATSHPNSALDKPIEKQKPNFAPTGKLAAASNTIQTANQTIVLKYHEPSEARKPAMKDQWRLYIFKGEDILDTVELSEQSCWLIGRETAVADFPLDHPSCSKQHAVIQFRYLEKRNEFGDKIGKVKPYLLDLESANGTLLNEEQIPTAKYVQLMDKDVIKFGHSSREYVIQLPSIT